MFRECAKCKDKVLTKKDFLEGDQIVWSQWNSRIEQSEKVTAEKNRNH